MFVWSIAISIEEYWSPENFAYDGTQGKSIRQIGEGGSDVEEKCGHNVVGKFPTNLKQHLKKSHAKEYKEMEEKEAENEKRKLEKQ